MDNAPEELDRHEQVKYIKYEQINSEFETIIARPTLEQLYSNVI